jgi:hypothetical protein
MKKVISRIVLAIVCAAGAVVTAQWLDIATSPDQPLHGSRVFAIMMYSALVGSAVFALA